MPFRVRGIAIGALLSAQPLSACAAPVKPVPDGPPPLASAGSTDEPEPTFLPRAPLQAVTLAHLCREAIAQDISEQSGICSGYITAMLDLLGSYPVPGVDPACRARIAALPLTASREVLASLSAGNFEEMSAAEAVITIVKDRLCRA